MPRAIRPERMIYRARGSALIPGRKWPREPSVAGDGEVSHTLRIEKCFSACFEQHRNRRAASCHHAQRRDHAYRLPVLDGPAGACIEEMTIPTMVDFEKALVIAAGGERAGRELDGCDDLVQPSRMANPDAPWSAVALRARGADVASQVDERMFETVLQAQRRHPIRGVFLAYAAEVYFHPAARQSDSMLAPFDIAPPDRRYRIRQR